MLRDDVYEMKMKLKLEKHFDRRIEQEHFEEALEIAENVIAFRESLGIERTEEKFLSALYISAMLVGNGIIAKENFYD